MKILLAEDDSNIAKIAQLSLEKLGGHTISLASDGTMAVQMARKNHYDLILMDSMMPKQDGLSACREICQIMKGNHPPILFLSAKSQETDIQEGIRAGAVGYISKPFDPRTLDAQIKEQLTKAGIVFEQVVPMPEAPLPDAPKTKKAA